MLEQIQGQWPLVVAVVMGLNLLLSAFSKALELIKDKTASDVDNKLFAVVGKLAGWLQKLVDYLGMNRQH